MLCITMVTYSFKLNGDPVGYVCPERGIRQEDSLSPYFFVMCAKGLSALLTKAELDGDLQGIKVVGLHLVSTTYSSRMTFFSLLEELLVSAQY